MPDRSSGHHRSLAARGSILFASSVLVYYATWRLLAARDLASQWLAPVWVGATYVVLGAAFYWTIWRPTRIRDRRTTSRVPIALPVRYSTEDGLVGVGVLVDITRQGAGLLVPRGAVSADRVWVQFLGFDDHTPLQGRVIHTQVTPDAERLGLALDRSAPETARLLSEFLIPFGHETLRHLGGAASAALTRPLSWWSARRGQMARPHHLPVLVEQGVLKIWAVTQVRTDEGAVLLLPQGLPNGAPVRIATWGSEDVRQCRIVHSEVLRRSPFPISRVVVRYDPRAASPRPADASDRVTRRLVPDGDPFAPPAIPLGR